ncbi:hypothetical protein ACTWP5_04620 [Streptomyces sp. 4N509B]|uniref:hypothetical protein n=1 Tax=Streptomyces sp. 4N509B TaxID=3457413 RepID=UPI003FCFFB4A
MSAGNNGAGMPPNHAPDDDPFAYLYRPEGPQADGQQAPPPRQPESYHQVRPVGGRTYGGGQGSPRTQPMGAAGYGQPPQPDAHYAAPETQGGAGAPGGRRRMPPPEPPRRNGLLIGAIAVVVAVVVGVGAAILFSGDETEPSAGGDPTGSETQGSDGEPGDEDPGDGESSPPGAGEPPVADLAALQLGGGARLESGIAGASSPEGNYVSGLVQGSTITWTFDFEGDPGQYVLYTTYATVSDDQTLAFSVNGTPRDDRINLRDFNGGGSDEWEESWYNTYNYVDLEQGSNTLEFSCPESCDVLIDQLYFTEEVVG